MIIRLERPDDYRAVLQITYQAFLTLGFPYTGRRRMDEHYLIHLLQGSPSVIRELCFVAEQDGEIIGHILYTKSEILHPDGSKTDTITFGPLSVHPQCQRQGVGSALVRHSMGKAREMGFGAVLIIGVPDYYPKLGFQRAREYGLTLADGTSPDALMAYELKSGYLSGGGKLRICAPEIDICETDDLGYQAFHERFMQEYYPNELILRPFWTLDIALLEGWLKMEHVARWFKHPEHWMREVRGREDEFDFITHFIAEINGVAIGFCQYYDCFFAKEHEEWNEEWHVGEKQGEDYSIDYLIGAPENLSKGYGKEIVRLLTEKVRSLGAKRVIVEPDNDNIASYKVLVANGYQNNGSYYVKEF